MLESWSGSGLNSPVPACIHTLLSFNEKEWQKQAGTEQGPTLHVYTSQALYKSMAFVQPHKLERS